MIPQYKKLSNDFFYKNDDIETISVFCNGHVTGGSEIVDFTVISPKNMKNINKITVESGRIVIRGRDGYIGDSGNNPINLLSSNITLDVVKRSINSFTISVKKDSAYANATNNTPVSVYASGLKLRFNKN